ncbi:MAG TPA: hypothetical protein VID68_10545 [Solirubrobacteraceae bacterium]
MALVDSVTRVVASAMQLRGPTANLANTRALVVEPMLNALGWDTTNLEQVARDWPLRGNYSISYALRVGDRSALFVQTMPIDVGIEDSGLVEETLDHVSGAESGWCLITNGLHYRVFKADEAVAHDNRLLFELELAEVASEPSSDAARDLALLSRESLINGSLELRGEESYIDPRVRQALLDLCRNPSASFLEAMNEAVGGPSVPAERVRASLARTVDRGRRQNGPATGLMQESLQRPRTSHTPPEQGGGESGESSSEPDPAQAGRFAPPPSAPTRPAPRTSERTKAKAKVRASDFGTALAAPAPAPDVREELAAEPEPAPELESIGVSSVAVVELSEPEAQKTATDEVEFEVGDGESALSQADWNEQPQSRFGAGRAEHPLVDHLTGKSPELVELFAILDRYARSLGVDTRRRVRKRSIDYSRGRRSWFSLEIRGDSVTMMVSLDPRAIERWVAEDSQRQPIAVGPGLFGESEFTLMDSSKLDDGRDLLRLSYDRLAPGALA